jgi:succinate dehydrogenase flavin-adding protein (antitoxin of CptAB toxin-antitoxin module)
MENVNGMPEILKRFPTTYRYVLTVLGSLLLFYIATVSMTQLRLVELRETIRGHAHVQHELAISVANLVSQNGADEMTAVVIRDCSPTERTEFDTLLGSLDTGLPLTELQELERLFSRCGDFFAQRKALMANRLTREVEVLESYLTQLATLEGDSVLSEYKLASWKQLAEEERKQGEHFLKLVALQGEIINALLEGKSAQSDEIEAILSEVSAVQGILIVANRQATTLRTGLLAP